MKRSISRLSTNGTCILIMLSLGWLFLSVISFSLSTNVRAESERNLHELPEVVGRAGNKSSPKTSSPLRHFLAPTINYVVTTTGDVNYDGVCDADCSLREAIEEANANPGADTISFNIPSNDTGCSAGRCTISTSDTDFGELPSITEAVTIDGYTQTGASQNSQTIGTNAQLKIVLSGSSENTGLLLDTGSSGSTIRGLAFFANGISIDIRSSSNTIEGNFIGTTTGTAGGGGVDGDGIIINGSNNTIGGTSLAARNLISGIGSSFALPGIEGAAIVIGRLSSLDPGQVNNNVVQGNYIGTNAAGTGALPNRRGIIIKGHNNVIGGTVAGAGNVIAFNSGPSAIHGSGISTAKITALSAEPTGNRISGNSIFSNNRLGIDLGSTGVTPNDQNDTDTGANNLQNFPVITSAASNGATSTVQGTLQSTPGTIFTIEVFSNAVGCDGSGFGEGQTFLGSTTATTDANGNAAFTYNHPAALAPALNITATATDPSNNTSEFSQCATVLQLISLTIDDLMIAEGNIGQVNAVFTIRLSAVSGNDVTVQYSTQNDSAASPSDYQSVTNSTATIPAGSLTGTFTVLINSDVIFEGNEQFFINLSNATNAVIADSQATAIINDDEPTNADFDGDGRTDASVWRSSTGNWYWNRSSDSTRQTHVDWGRDTLGDIAVPGDYDGDNKTDLAVWRPSEGNWYIVNSSFGSPGGAANQTTVKGWGLGSLGDVPVPADYDGDGKTDFAIWRGPEGNWYIINSGTNTVTLRNWGASSFNDKPVVGDYDGDGRADIAVWRPSEGNWYIINSSNNTVTLRAWGAGSLNDKPVHADYDGDGKTDIAVWRPSEGNWYIINSSNNSTTVKGWGAGSLNDVPVPGNYDGDNKADIAVWRPDEGNWYIISSRDNVVILLNLGLTGDVLIPAAYFLP